MRLRYKMTSIGAQKWKKLNKFKSITIKRTQLMIYLYEIIRNVQLCVPQNFFTKRKKWTNY